MDRDKRRNDASKGGRAPPAGASAEAAKDERTARLEQALRANLRRRKAQSRARADAEAPAQDSREPE